MEDFAFPNDLIGDIKSRWKAASAVGEAGLPDDGILQRLLEICYHASLRTTEHRPVHCVVAYIPLVQPSTEGILLLERPVPLTEDQIVRLAPVADMRRTQIACAHIDGKLQIWGLIEHDLTWGRFASDPFEAAADERDLPPDCLMIALEQPGSLSIFRGRRGLVRLRGGRVIVPRENPLRDVNVPLGRFFFRLVEELRRSAAGQDILTPYEYDEPRSLLDVYTTSVAAMLERIRLRREGGSIVITCTRLDTALVQITYTVGANPGLAPEILGYYQALRRTLWIRNGQSDAAGQLATSRAELALQQASQRLSRGISQISLLAGVDGAVLLNDRLKIQGFGVRFPVLLPVGASVLDANTGIEHPCDRWGLRHQSMFSLCQKCDQVIGLVVSQDGEAKAIKSEGGQLYLWDAILD